MNGLARTNVLEVDNLSKEFPIKSGLLQRETGRVRATAGRPTRSSNSLTLARRCDDGIPLTSSGSAMMSPTIMRGLSEA